MQPETIHPSSGNVFTDLGFADSEATILNLRAELMAKLREDIAARGWTQLQAAEALHVSQSRVSDLIRGKWDKFSLDMLITLATRLGNQVRLELGPRAV